MKGKITRNTLVPRLNANRFFAFCCIIATTQFFACKRPGKFDSVNGVSDADSAAELQSEQSVKTSAESEILELSQIVRSKRTRDGAMQQASAMDELLKKWSPIGKNASIMLSILGEPNRNEDGRMVYTFDDGYNTYEVTLLLHEGLVSKAEIVTQ